MQKISSCETQKEDDEEAKTVGLHLRDFWRSQALYYILPNEIYFWLGAQVSDSEGESDWYSLCEALCLYSH